jgi:hypothetical protein
MLKLTRMFKGAAKTHTDKATQSQPRTLTRTEPLTRKCARRRIKENNPKFIEISSLIVETCIRRFNSYY